MTIEPALEFAMSRATAARPSSTMTSGSCFFWYAFCVLKQASTNTGASLMTSVVSMQ